MMKPKQWLQRFAAGRSNDKMSPTPVVATASLWFHVTVALRALVGLYLLFGLLGAIVVTLTWRRYKRIADTARTKIKVALATDNEDGILIDKNLDRDQSAHIDDSQPRKSVADTVRQLEKFKAAPDAPLPSAGGVDPRKKASRFSNLWNHRWSGSSNNINNNAMNPQKTQDPSGRVKTNETVSSSKVVVPDPPIIHKKDTLPEAKTPQPPSKKSLFDRWISRDNNNNDKSPEHVSESIKKETMPVAMLKNAQLPRQESKTHSSKGTQDKAVVPTKQEKQTLIHETITMSATLPEESRCRTTTTPKDETTAATVAIPPDDTNKRGNHTTQEADRAPPQPLVPPESAFNLDNLYEAALADFESDPIVVTKVEHSKDSSTHTRNIDKEATKKPSIQLSAPVTISNKKAAKGFVKSNKSEPDETLAPIWDNATPHSQTETTDNKQTDDSMKDSNSFVRTESSLDEDDSEVDEELRQLVAEIEAEPKADDGNAQEEMEEVKVELEVVKDNTKEVSSSSPPRETHPRVPKPKTPPKGKPKTTSRVMERYRKATEAINEQQNTPTSSSWQSWATTLGANMMQHPTSQTTTAVPDKTPKPPPRPSGETGGALRSVSENLGLSALLNPSTGEEGKSIDPSSLVQAGQQILSSFRADTPPHQSVQPAPKRKKLTDVERARLFAASVLEESEDYERKKKGPMANWFKSWT